MGMPGHMGDERVAVQNLQVVQVRREADVVPVSGVLPGAKKATIVIIENGKGTQAVHSVVTAPRTSRRTGSVKDASSTRKS